MKTKAFCLFGLAAAGAVAVSALPGSAQVPARNESVMRQKLAASQKALEAVSIADYDVLEKAGSELVALSKRAEWQAFKTVEYVRQTEEFRHRAGCWPGRQGEEQRRRRAGLRAAQHELLQLPPSRPRPAHGGHAGRSGPGALASARHRFSDPPMDIARLIAELAKPEAYPDPVDGWRCARRTSPPSSWRAARLQGQEARLARVPRLLHPGQAPAVLRGGGPLNRRLAPRLPGRGAGDRGAGGVRVEGAGEPIEWAVKMARLPDEARSRPGWRGEIDDARSPSLARRSPPSTRGRTAGRGSRSRRRSPTPPATCATTSPSRR